MIVNFAILFKVQPTRPNSVETPGMRIFLLSSEKALT